MTPSPPLPASADVERGRNTSSVSYAQRHFLERLVRQEKYGGDWGASHCNRTGAALEKRGLVAYEYDHSKAYTWGRWLITDAGRAALT